MAEIIQKMRIKEKTAVIFRDLDLISLIALACFFVFEKKWPGLISNYIHPAILVAFWLIALFLHSIGGETKKWDFIQIIFGIVLIILIFIFFLKALGPWRWMIILIIPTILLSIGNIWKK